MIKRDDLPIIDEWLRVLSGFTPEIDVYDKIDINKECNKYGKEKVSALIDELIEDGTVRVASRFNPNLIQAVDCAKARRYLDSKHYYKIVDDREKKAQKESLSDEKLRLEVDDLNKRLKNYGLTKFFAWASFFIALISIVLSTCKLLNH